MNVASVAAQVGQAACAASKAGIRVNTILPGMLRTPLLMTLSKEIRESLFKSVPFPQRLGRSAECASLASLMITNGNMNGERVSVGRSAWPPKRPKHIVNLKKIIAAKVIAVAAVKTAGGKRKGQQ